MDHPLLIPRDALAALLKAAGSTQTPEEYLASLPPKFDPYEKYIGRAIMAACSKYFLLVAAIITGIWTCLPFGFGIESALITIALVIFTFFEFRVCRAFNDRKPSAPMLGFRNQTAFAIFIALYCLYHAFFPSMLLTHYRESMDIETSQLIRTISFAIYIGIGFIGGISQFGLALYYRAARTAT